MGELAGRDVAEQRRVRDQVRAELRRARREYRRATRRCFWSWPWGHDWGLTLAGPTTAQKHCLACPKVVRSDGMDSWDVGLEAFKRELADRVEAGRI